eukprot:151213_1
MAMLIVLAQQCNITLSSTKNIINKCTHLRRIANALKYYQSHSYNDQLFIDFCEDKYSMFVDDYIHLIRVHSNHTKYIASDLLQNENYIQCAIKSCKSTHRHFRDRYYSNIYKKTDEYSIYIEILDTIHFFLFHLEETGLRTIKEREIKDNDIDFVSVSDMQTTEIQNQIHSKGNQCGLHVESETNNTKFSIIIGHNNHMDKNGNTVMEELLSYLSKTICDDTNDKYKLKMLNDYLFTEEYDTDCIFYDICDDSNIKLRVLNDNDRIFKHIIMFKISHKESALVFSKAFSTGIVFWYWKWYKNITNEQYKLEQSIQYGSEYNQNDFGGHLITDLSVTACYQNVKEEIFMANDTNSIAKFITIGDYKNGVINKAQYWIKATQCRKLQRIVGTKNEPDPLHYDIPFDMPIHQSHLHALILYCDFSAFCTEWSATFRAIQYNESIELIKDRNSKYYHVSKYLREIVQYYGINGNKYDTHNGTQNGPFYTGMSMVLHIPSFAIRLNGPTSTSKHIEVALRFSGRDGIVIQLNNEKGLSKKETFFDSSWISKYPEEDERIFCGGRHKLELESIRVFDTASDQWKNYGTFMNSFYLFDAMLSGDLPVNSKISSSDINVVEKCINYYLEGKQHSTLDDYICNSFNLFCKSKTQIIFNLDDIAFHTRNNNFADLIKCNKFKIQNLCKPIMLPLLFKLFKNLKQIIYTGGSSKYSSFDIAGLSSIIDPSMLPKSFEKITLRNASYWVQISKQIADSFGQKKLTILNSGKDLIIYRQESFEIVVASGKKCRFFKNSNRLENKLHIISLNHDSAAVEYNGCGQTPLSILLDGNWIVQSVEKETFWHCLLDTVNILLKTLNICPNKLEYKNAMQLIEMFIGFEEKKSDILWKIIGRNSFGERTVFSLFEWIKLVIKNSVVRNSPRQKRFQIEDNLLANNKAFESGMENASQHLRPYSDSDEESIFDSELIELTDSKIKQLSLRICSEQFAISKDGTDKGLITFVQQYINSTHLEKIFRKYCTLCTGTISNVNQLTEVLSVCIVFYKAKVFQINSTKKPLEQIHKETIIMIAKCLANWIVSKYSLNDDINITPQHFQNKMYLYLQEFVDENQTEQTKSETLMNVELCEEEKVNKNEHNNNILRNKQCKLNEENKIQPAEPAKKIKSKYTIISAKKINDNPSISSFQEKEIILPVDHEEYKIAPKKVKLRTYNVCDDSSDNYKMIYDYHEEPLMCTKLKKIEVKRELVDILLSKTSIILKGELYYNTFKQYGKLLNVNEKETESVWSAIDIEESGRITICQLLDVLKRLQPFKEYLHH